MTMKSGFFDARQTVVGTYDREYDSDDFSRCFSGFMGNGVVGKNRELSESFEVVKGELTGNTVRVKPGQAWIDGRWCQDDTGMEFAISLPAPTGKMRVDAIFIRCDYSERTFSLVKKSGIDFDTRDYPDPKDYPIPEPQYDEEAKEIILAYIYVSDLSTTIDDAIIYDYREFANFKLNDHALDGLVFKKCTQAEYDNMSVHYSDTIYIIYEEE